PPLPFAARPTFLCRAGPSASRAAARRGDVPTPARRRQEGIPSDALPTPGCRRTPGHFCQLGRKSRSDPMRIPDAACDVSFGGNPTGVDGTRDLIEVATDRAHAIGKQAKHCAVLFPKERPHASTLHGERSHESGKG